MKIAQRLLMAEFRVQLGKFYYSPRASDDPWKQTRHFHPLL
jgi:hypothetical protein